MCKLSLKQRKVDSRTKKLPDACAQTLRTRNNDFHAAQLLAFPADRFELG